MIDLQFVIPEIFLAVSIFILLLVGVFIKNSFEIIYRLTIFVIFLMILIVLSGDNETVKVFNESFVIDGFALYSKALILIASFFTNKK